MRDKIRNQRGYLAVEAMMAVVIFVVMVIGLFSAVGFLATRARGAGSDTEAGLIMQEGIEVGYNILMTGWMRFGEGEYFPARSTVERGGKGEWVLLPGKENGVKAKYARWIEIERVCRIPVGEEQAGERTNCLGGEIDLNSRLIRSVVEWEEEGEWKRIEEELVVAKI